MWEGFILCTALCASPPGAVWFLQDPGLAEAWQWEVHMNSRLCCPVVVRKPDSPWHPSVLRPLESLGIPVFRVAAPLAYFQEGWSSWSVGPVATYDTLISPLLSPRLKI